MLKRRRSSWKVMFLVLVLLSGTPRAPQAADGIAEKTLEKTREYQFGDGVILKVHFTDEILEESREDIYFVKEVLDAAVFAYQMITQFQGFSSPGFSFASSNKSYAYDPDRAIDIYLGHPDDNKSYRSHGFGHISFKDAPCFDTVKVAENQYQAVILLPSKYREFISNWEKINPSPLGARHVGADLRGTLIHEMLHVILFYYNKNLNKDPGSPSDSDKTQEMPRSKRIDWYVEGLARYFETFAGARHDFFSQGFKQTLPDKIRFSRGGSNYFMRYPDQAFTELRYENALFWRFVDYRYGMPAIEKLSRNLRGVRQTDFRSALEEVTKSSFNELLKSFAAAILFKDFGLKGDTRYLKDIARTHLVYREGQLFLRDGFGEEKPLGSNSRTDWIGEWDDQRAAFGELSVAGDDTEKSDVSGWATDFYQIDITGDPASLPWLGLSQGSEGQPLAVQAFIVSKGGSVFRMEMSRPKPGSGEAGGLALNHEIEKEGLQPKDIDKIYLLITNTDPTALVSYEIVTKPA